MEKPGHLEIHLLLLYTIFFISIFCSFRAITSISIFLIIVTGLLKNKRDTGSWLGKRLKNSLFLLCMACFCIQATFLVLSQNHTDITRHLTLKTAIIFVPLMVCCGNYPSLRNFRNVLDSFVLVFTGMMFTCLCIGIYKYFFLNQPVGVFFYHALVKPFDQHAVQISILGYFCVLYLLESIRSGRYLIHKIIHYVIMLFCIGCIMLLSSKLVILFLAVTLIYYIASEFKKPGNLRRINSFSLVVGLVLIICIFATPNPVSKRFGEILSGKVSLVQQKNFDPGIYFNGLQFRLLQWRFVYEILNDKHAWLFGVSDNAQIFLNEKYLSTHMYTGEPTGPDKGFIGYDTHNQFLESILRTGIFGLGVFMALCYAMLQLAYQRKQKLLSYSVCLLLAYCFNESLLEGQYSITIFLFFPLFFYYAAEEQLPSPQENSKKISFGTTLRA